jgi:hypothetical protein
MDDSIPHQREPAEPSTFCDFSAIIAHFCQGSTGNPGW